MLRVLGCCESEVACPLQRCKGKPTFSLLLRSCSFPLQYCTFHSLWRLM